MRCLRILPEIAASTTCALLSSLTLKNALGCLSIMVPSAGIKSSLANRVSPLVCSLLLVMLNHAFLQRRRNAFPVRVGQRLGRKVTRRNARHAPQADGLF